LLCGGGRPESVEGQAERRATVDDEAAAAAHGSRDGLGFAYLPTLQEGEDSKVHCGLCKRIFLFPFDGIKGSIATGAGFAGGQGALRRTGTTDGRP
jgi:hypothetical protein